MPTNGLRKTIDRLRQVLNPRDLPDEQLLKQFIALRDEGAFAMLVRRHGPMVLGVSRRIVGNVHDSEDVFQATFLVLAQKARSVVNRQTIGSWLYRVAYRIALKAQAANARRRQRERQVEHMPHPQVAPREIQDWQAILDHELDRLPEKYRAPIILCDLEGRTRKEVERQLRLPEGTLSSRLTTARRLLAQRLTRRGVTLSGGALATAMSEATACVPPSLAGSTVKAALLVAAGKLGAVSAPVAVLMKGAITTMFLTKLKATLATVMILAFVGGSIVYSGGGQSKAPSELEALRKENELLKINLRVTLEKIQTLENELATFKGRKGAPAGAAADLLKALHERMAVDVEFRAKASQQRREAEAQSRRAIEAEKAAKLKAAGQKMQLQNTDLAIKALRDALNRQDDNQEARQRAVEALEKALKYLREQERKPKRP